MHSTQESIFTKVRRENPERIVWENQQYFVLNDIRPQAKVHFLVIPKKEVRTLLDMSAQEIGELIETAKLVAKAHFGVPAYQVQINVNAPYQEVFHVHVHVKSNETPDA